MLDFNRQPTLADAPISVAINEFIARVEPRQENDRQYLGASAIGGACLRKMQFEWMCDAEHPPRILDIFRRGHLFEALTREHLKRASFQFAPPERLAFEAFGGLFRGHADGILLVGPDLPGVAYPCIWEHKALRAKNWRALARDGLAKTFPQYAAQVAVYQAQLGASDHPAIFTAVNADTMERLHLLVPFDAELARAALDRASTVIEATRAGELLPRLTEDRDDWRCKLCGHSARCWRLEP